MTNAMLEKAIAAAGGVTAVAYHVGKSEVSVYGWRRAGRVFDVRDALTLQALATKGGVDVTLVELAGLEGWDGEPRPGGLGARDEAIPASASRRTRFLTVDERHSDSQAAA